MESRYISPEELTDVPSLAAAEVALVVRKDPLPRLLFALIQNKLNGTLRVK